jgi:hypothetical protein
MADVKTWVPEGFTDGRHALITERLERRVALVGPRGGPERLVVRAKPGADIAALESLLLEHPAWRSRAVLPGLWEVNVMPEELPALTGRDDLIAWVDVSGRMTGAVPAMEGTAAIQVTPAKGGGAAIEAKVKELGGSVAGSGASGLLVRLAVEALADLLRLDEIEAIDVAGLG